MGAAFGFDVDWRYEWGCTWGQTHAAIILIPVKKDLQNYLLLSIDIFTPKWWNWQTRQIQVLVPAMVWGFKSLLRHHNKIKRLREITYSLNLFCRFLLGGLSPFSPQLSQAAYRLWSVFFCATAMQHGNNSPKRITQTLEKKVLRCANQTPCNTQVSLSKKRSCANTKSRKDEEEQKAFRRRS